MRPIQMVDLKQQYHKIRKEVDAAISDVLESSAFIAGKPVQEFATELAQYLGVRHVIPCANGTDALQIAMMALGLKPGDEVITPSFTFIATTEVAALLNLTPVFVDVDRAHFCMDPESLERAITPRTKAIVPVHLYGHSSQMDEIMQIADKNGLHVIEDNAQAIGGIYHGRSGSKKSGTIGHVGTTSFFPSKNLGGYGDGGAVFTDDDELAGKLRMIANHGQIKRYYYEMVGCNSRLDTLQAAILRIKLKHLDDYIDSRIKVADLYDVAFANHPLITIPFRASWCKHVFHQYTLLIGNPDGQAGDRDGLVKFLADNGIPSMIYYPVPGHRQKMFAHLPTSKVDLPATDWLTERVISLPIHTEMDKEQIDFITSKVLAFFN